MKIIILTSILLSLHPGVATIAEERVLDSALHGTWEAIYPRNSNTNDEISIKIKALVFYEKSKLAILEEEYVRAKLTRTLISVDNIHIANSNEVTIREVIFSFTISIQGDPEVETLTLSKKNSPFSIKLIRRDNKSNQSQ